MKKLLSKYSLAVAVVLLMTAACKTTPNNMLPAESDTLKTAAFPGSPTFADLKSGYKLFVTNCSGCHSLYKPDSRTREHWNQVLPEMFSRTQLDSAECRLVKNYIFSKL